MAWTSPTRSLATVAALCALWACTETPAPPPPPVTAKTGLVPCSSEAECGPATPTCDRERRICVCTVVRNPDNSVTDSCGAQHCNPFTGQCVANLPGCSLDTDCDSDQYCDRPVRTCKKRLSYCDSCRTDNECGGAEDYCIPHPDFPSVPVFCGKVCADDGDCAALAKCAAIPQLGGQKQCIPKFGTCETVSGCTADSNAACNVDADCNDTKQRCDLDVHTCVAKIQICEAPEQVCDPRTNACIAACRNDADCGRGFRCDHGLCLSIGACLNHTDCPAGKLCLQDGATEGECIDGCSGEHPCPLGQTCVNTGARNECRTSCALDGDCPLNTICGGAPATCTPASDGRCQITGVCPSCNVCDAGKRCTSQAAQKHCETCNPNTTNACGTGFMCLDMDVNDGNRCYQACDPSAPLTCPAGSYCLGTGYGPSAGFGFPVSCTSDTQCRNYANAHCDPYYGFCLYSGCLPVTSDGRCGTFCQ